MIWYRWVQQSCWNQLLVHRRLVIPLFAWVLWVHRFWVLGYCQVFQNILFWLHMLLWHDYVVYSLALLGLYVGICVKYFQCIQECLGQPLYLCSSSLVKRHKINSRFSLNLPPHSLIWDAYQAFCVLLVWLFNAKIVKKQRKFYWKGFAAPYSLGTKKLLTLLNLMEDTPS